MSKSAKIVIVAVGIAAVGFGASRLFRPRAKASPYHLVAADRGDISMIVSATGSLSAVTTVQVGSQVSGIIARLYADFNSRVKKGQLLAELDPTPFLQAIEQQQANVAKAQVDAANARTAFLRQERLKGEGLAAQADYDNAKATADSDAAQVDLARASLAQAQTNLKYSKIVSPVDGIVVNRAYDVGQTVAASFQAPTLFTIAQDLTKMQVQADVDESDIGRVRIGEPAQFTVDAFPDQTFRATVSQIRLNATVNQNVVTYPVMIAVDNPGEKLRPSMTANVSINVAKVQNVLRIPNSALRFKPSPSAIETGAGGEGAPAVRPGLASALSRKSKPAGPTVYVAAASGKLRPVSVRTGITDGQWTEVLDGDLKEGDRVVAGLATARSGETGTSRPMRF